MEDRSLRTTIVGTGISAAKKKETSCCSCKRPRRDDGASRIGHAVCPFWALSLSVGSSNVRRGAGDWGKLQNRDAPLFETRPLRFPFAADDRGRTISSVAGTPAAKRGVAPTRRTRFIVLLLPVYEILRPPVASSTPDTLLASRRHGAVLVVISGTISPAVVRDDKTRRQDRRRGPGCLSPYRRGVHGSSRVKGLCHPVDDAWLIRYTWWQIL